MLQSHRWFVFTLAIAVAGGAFAGDDFSTLTRLVKDHFKSSDGAMELLGKNAKDGPDHYGVYFWLSKESGKDVNYVLRLRLAGDSWSVVFTKLDVDINKIFVTMPQPPGPPYGKAYGHWKHGGGHHGKGKQKGAKGKYRPPALTDVEVCDWVNARAISVALSVDLKTVLDRRSAGQTIFHVAAQMKKEKDAPSHEKDKPDKDEHGKPEGKGKDKGKP